MKHPLAELEHRLAALPIRVSVELPSGQRLGAAQGDVHVVLRSPAAYAALAQGQIGALGAAVVEGWVELQGRMRDVMAAAGGLLRDDPVRGTGSWWSNTMHRARSMALHTLERDAQQVQFHYDLSDDFYALWLDPRRVYSCAYYRDPGMDLAQAQAAKLDHICRKLHLQPGERLLDIGCGWGGLIVWAAQQYGVRAKGITLSHNQYHYVRELIVREGLEQQVEVALCDYRAVDDAAYDKLASVGMFEHVGQAQLPAYFQSVQRLLRPGGMALVHGITAGGTRNRQLGAGMGEFIDRYIFPGGELVHVSAVLQAMADAGLEMVDTENLRPHYARTLWAWSDALEAQLVAAQAVLTAQTDATRAQRALRAYRLYLAGCAMGFEQGWMGLHQMLAVRPNGALDGGALRGAQSDYPFHRHYMYREGPASMAYVFQSRATADLTMLRATAEHILQLLERPVGEAGVFTVEQIPAVLQRLEQAVAEDEARRQAVDAAAEAEDGATTAEVASSSSELGSVSLRQRVVPLADMLRRSAAEGKPVTWKC